MTAPLRQITVSSHVGRDLLQSAALFRNEAAVVWEYVVNSLQYVERGIAPSIEIRVDPSNHRIEISDNGRGMTSSDLQNHFFTMHGENIDRKSGKSGRGKFGTGKSAAFGIANTMSVNTVKNGRRNIVRLTREAINSSSGDKFPVEWVAQDIQTDDPPGTRICIEDILLTRIKAQPIIEYIERHLQSYHASNPRIAVNSHVCEIRMPEIARSETFSPLPEEKKILGDISLEISVALAPLSSSAWGVIVTSGEGNLIAVETGGIESKECGNYLFGRVDVPAIEEFETEIEPYNSTRDLRLNPQHPVVATLVGFIGACLEKVRNDLVLDLREARKDETSRRLRDEADRIANLLNEDFQSIRQRLQAIRTHSAHPGAVSSEAGARGEGGEDLDTWVRGAEAKGILPTRENRKGGGDGAGRDYPDVRSGGTKDPEGKDLLDPAGGNAKRHGRPRGGFRVEYRGLGESEDRSMYDAARLTILINLDHPVVKSALGGGSVEDLAFRRLSYEVAFSEYSFALGYEIANQDPNIAPDDLLYEVRSSLNRIARLAAQLYQKG